MRRRPTLAALAALFPVLLLVAGCSDDGGDDTADDTTTTAAEAEGDGPTTTAPEAEDAEVDCAAYDTVTALFAELEEIAGGSSEQQAAADDELDTAVAALTPSAEGDEIVSEALATLGEVSFRVTDDPDAGPSADDIDAALVTLDAAWGERCAAEGDDDGSTSAGSSEGSAGEPGEDGEDGEGGEGGATAECPAPEVLEAEGFSCDSEGNLIPLDEETTTECPAPEVLEAEGYTCDSEGHLTPIAPDEGEVPADDTEPAATDPETTVPE